MHFFVFLRCARVQWAETEWTSWFMAEWTWFLGQSPQKLMQHRYKNVTTHSIVCRQISVARVALVFVGWPVNQVGCAHASAKTNCMHFYAPYVQNLVNIWSKMHVCKCICMLVLLFCIVKGLWATCPAFPEAEAPKTVSPQRMTLII